MFDNLYYNKCSSPNVEDWANINFKWISIANFFLQLRLILKRQIANVNIVLKREGELAVRENSVFS